jgi:predicted nucleotidyltransferase
MSILSNHIEQIKNACASNKVRTLFAFGSVTNDKFNEDSDVDLVVDIDETNPIEYSDKYFNLKEQLEVILNRQIDLLEHKSIRNPILKQEIDQTKILIYGG